jgi:hypothetical protein
VADTHGTYTLNVGDRVRIVEFDSKEKIVGVYRGRGETGSPEFRSENGSIIHGYECWWLPLEDAIEIESKHQEEDTHERRGDN